MNRRAAVRHAVIEHLLASDDPCAWQLGAAVTENLFGARTTDGQHAMVWTVLHRLHDEGLVQFKRHGAAQHAILVRLDPVCRETRGWMSAHAG